MAPLANPHWETITPAMKDVLAAIGECAFSQRFYLAGGTALALRLGHRRSVDLDFFSETDEVMRRTRREIVQGLIPLGVQVLEDVDGNLLTVVSELHVGFFSYGYRLLEPTETVCGIAVASLIDIGLMKLDALVGRGSRKDFYDVYALAQQTALQDMLTRAASKYPYARDFALMAVESMVLFENADRDLQPDLLVKTPWPEVRRFFIAQAQALGESWFGL